MLQWLFGKSKTKVAEPETEDDAISISWSVAWPDLRSASGLVIAQYELSEPMKDQPLPDDAQVSREGMFKAWPIGTNFQFEYIGTDQIRLHALPRRYDHTNKPDLTNALSLIPLKGKTGSLLCVISFDYGYGVHHGSPENLHGERVVQRYVERDRSFYRNIPPSPNGVISATNINWPTGAKESFILKPI